MPKFTIIIPTYNRADFLPVAIQSIVNQSISDWELIIIDDGSVDNTAAVVQKFAQADGRIQYIHQKNQERSAARNHGVRRGAGVYVCFLDSDDYYLPQHLEYLNQATEALRNPQAFFYTGLMEQVGTQPPTKNPLPAQVNPNFVQHFLDFTVYPTTTCIHRSILNKYTFDTRLSLWEDTALWLQIGTEFAVHQVAHHTAVLRMHAQSTTHATDRQLNIAHCEGIMNIKKNRLSQPILQPFITQKSKNKFIARMYGYYFYDSLGAHKKWHALYFLLKSFYTYPPALFTKIGIADWVMLVRNN